MASRKLSDKELQKIGSDMMNFFEYGYKDKKKMMYTSFLKGLATGFGVFLGGTVLIVLLIWVLSFFDNLPVLEHLYRTLNNSYN